MKQILFFFISLITILILISCIAPIKRSPNLQSFGITWEKKFHKNDLEQFAVVVFSSDNQRFLTSDTSDSIKLYQEPFTSPAKNLQIKDYDTLITMQFFGDQDDIFIAFQSGYFQIWDNQLKNKKSESQIGRGCRMAAISPNARFIAIGGHLYDRQKKAISGSEIGHILQTGLSFGNDSSLLTSGYYDYSIAVRNTQNGTYERIATPHRVYDAGISPNEKYVAAVTSEGRCYLWHWPDQKPKKLVIPRGFTDFMGFSPDSEWFIVNGEEYMSIFQADPPARIARLKHPSHEITSIKIASNNLIIIGDEHGYVRIYDLTAEKTITRQKILSNPIAYMKFVKEKSCLWVGSSTYNMKVNKKGEVGLCEVALFQVKGLDPYIKSNKIPEKK